jgi:hypothetical protein
VFDSGVLRFWKTERFGKRWVDRRFARHGPTQYTRAGWVPAACGEGYLPGGATKSEIGFPWVGLGDWV